MTLVYRRCAGVHRAIVFNVYGEYLFFISLGYSTEKNRERVSYGTQKRNALRNADLVFRPFFLYATAAVTGSALNSVPIVFYQTADAIRTRAKKLLLIIVILFVCKSLLATIADNLYRVKRAINKLYYYFVVLLNPRDCTKHKSKKIRFFKLRGIFNRLFASPRELYEMKVMLLLEI